MARFLVRRLVRRRVVGGSLALACALSLLAPWARAADFATARDGAYGAATTWSGGTAPTGAAAVTITHQLSASSLTIGSGTSVTLGPGGVLRCAGGVTIAGGSLSVAGGMLVVGPAGGGDRSLRLKAGSLAISAGEVAVNGDVALVGGAFTLTGGTLTVDPNSGVAATSLASGVDVVAVAAACRTTVSGGVIRIVDPPFAGEGRSFAYLGAKGDASWVGSTLVLGDDGGSAAPPPSAAGFIVDTCANGGGWCELGDVVVAGGAGDGRFVTSVPIANHGLDVAGDLVIRAKSELRLAARGPRLRLCGDLRNDGVLTDGAGIRFGGRSGPATRPQQVTGAQANFRHPRAPKTPGCFTALEFDNVATPIAVSFRIGNLYVSDALVLANGAIANLGRPGTTGNHLYLTHTCELTRVHGTWATAGKFATLSREFVPGASSFTYHVADLNDPAKDAAITVDLAANDQDRWIGIAFSSAIEPDLAAHPPAGFAKGFWEMYGDMGGTLAGRIAFAYDRGDVVGDDRGLRCGWWDGSAWTALGPAAKDGRVVGALSNPHGNTVECHFAARAFSDP